MIYETSIHFVAGIGRAAGHLALLAPRRGTLARGHDRGLRAPHDFFWRALIPRFAEGAMNPPPDPTAEKAAAPDVPDQPK